jgi:hypothetical protein
MKNYNIYFAQAHRGLGGYLLDPSGSISNENTPQGEYWSGSYAEAEDLIDARGWALAEILEAE